MTETIVQLFGPQFQMWATFAIIAGALLLYISERLPIEITSISVICLLLVFFHFFPVAVIGGGVIGPGRILRGFSNPALITVLALLVMGQGMVRTGILDRGARLVLGLGRGKLWLSVLVVLSVSIAVSAFLNNIPVVVIFIPVMQAMAARFGEPASRLMIPLSFAAVLGGMTTLIGSSTNLLVNSALIEMGERPFDFFEFSVPGMVLAAVGLVYVFAIAPRLLPDRGRITDQLLPTSGRQFIAEITVSAESEHVGAKASGGFFSDLPEMTVRVVQRGPRAILPPFENYVVEPGDILVVAATRRVLTEAINQDQGLLYPQLTGVPEDSDGGNGGGGDAPWAGGEPVLAEVMVAPASRLIGRNLSQIGFRYQTNCIVLGVQRRAHMLRGRITDIRLEAGDVLLIKGQWNDIDALKASRDVVLFEWSAEELPVLTRAKRATFIFVCVIALGGSGLLPVVVAALSGAALMVVGGVLNARQAFRAVDPLVVTTIAMALALGVAMQETGGAEYLADGLARAMAGFSPAVMLSSFFLLVAVLSNVISTKTTAVLFTPIAIDLAHAVGAPPEAFAVAVVFAANCSFASPLGYQTNLLVMGPGNYRFTDYFRAGIPLLVLLWIVFSLLAPAYYGM